MDSAGFYKFLINRSIHPQAADKVSIVNGSKYVFPAEAWESSAK
jgi:hypothetical protein